MILDLCVAASFYTTFTMKKPSAIVLITVRSNWKCKDVIPLILCVFTHYKQSSPGCSYASVYMWPRVCFCKYPFHRGSPFLLNYSSPFLSFGVWELQCSWENSALQPNRHSLKCATLLSFCQHHHCVELSQARHLTDSQMGVVDFSNITPSRCPFWAQRWGSLHLHTHTQTKKGQNL